MKCPASPWHDVQAVSSPQNLVRRRNRQSAAESLKAKIFSITAGRCKFGTSCDCAVHFKSSQLNESSWTALIRQLTQCGQGRSALRMYKEMQKDGVEPSPCTFVALFKACSSLQDLESAKRIHAEVVKWGFESDLCVGTMLVNVYAKCRSLADARHAFEKMPSRNVVSWTTMIWGYAQMNRGEKALELYHRMHQEGVEPNDRIYVSVLKACSTLAAPDDRNDGNWRSKKQRCLESVRAIHWNVRRGRFESDVFVGNTLVDVYAKCGSLEDARQVFENMPGRDVVSWNAMIFGYAQMNEGEEALQLYNRMLLEGVVPDNRTHVSTLKACSAMAESGEGDGMAVRPRCLELVRAIHRKIVEQNFESDVFIGTMLVDAYAKCRSLEDARCVFEKMPDRNVVTWNAMILGYAQMDKGKEALQLYARMLHEGMEPDCRTYVGALRACSSVADVREMTRGEGLSGKERCLGTVRSIHAAVLERKFESDLFVGNMLVDVYAKCGSLGDARLLFEKMPRRDIITWNVMILGYAQMEKGEEALQVYTWMQNEGVVPNGRTYVSALKACSVIAESVDFDGDGSALKARCLAIIRAIHTGIVKQKLDSGVFVMTMLVDAYAKAESLEDARVVFENIPQHDVVSWTAMIVGYAQMDKGEEALQLYTRMLQEGVEPNERTYVGALNACGSLAGLEKGKEVHTHILKAGLEGSNCFVTASLINMYGKCGSMVDARHVFDAVPERPIVAWNALIAGYAHQGDSELVVDLLHKMKQEGVQPDGITFLGVLTACSHVGLVSTGHKYFKVMSREYGITPTIKHYTCIIDLLGRSGQVQMAMEIANTMPFQPNSVVWECVLGACRKWGDVKLGKQAFECAVRLNKDDGAAYTQMSNIYAAAHMRQEAKETEAARFESRVRKQPGRTLWTDASGVAHVFVAGDQGHRAIPDIHATMDDLVIKMEKAGYLPLRVLTKNFVQKR